MGKSKESKPDPFLQAWAFCRAGGFGFSDDEVRKLTPKQLRALKSVKDEERKWLAREIARVSWILYCVNVESNKRKLTLDDLVHIGEAECKRKIDVSSKEGIEAFAASMSAAASKSK